MRQLTTYVFFALMAFAGTLQANTTAVPPNIYASSFEWDSVTPLFPEVAGDYQLTPGPTSNQLSWVVQQLSEASTSTADINAHFHPGFLAGTPATNLQNFFQTLRTTYPDAEVIDVVTVTPVRVTVVIQSPGGVGPKGFVQLGADYTGFNKITYFAVSNFNTVQYPADQALDLTQAVDKFQTLSSGAGLFIGRINLAGQCVPIVSRNPSTPRATASIFKTWVLGGVAAAITAGDATPDDDIPLVASELAPGGTINVEDIGDTFTLRDLAVLMLGISDNTATDLLHEWVGREVIEQYIGISGTSHPDLLLPLLGISEQFHLFFSFNLATSTSYVNGTEQFQRDFLNNQIAPLGALTSYPFNNESLFISGSWQASPLDVCANLAKLRRTPSGTDAFTVVDYAMGASTAQPDVRNRWDRVWYKGGSLESGINGYLVLTHAWMLERSGEQPYVVIAMSNDPTGGIDIYNVQSITGRILELVANMP